MGTLRYMAPEQARGEAVDHRADIYAFGLILRDMLLGGRADADQSAYEELSQRIEDGLPPARSIDAAIPEALDEVISRCVCTTPPHVTRPAPSLRPMWNVSTTRACRCRCFAGRSAGRRRRLAPPRPNASRSPS